MEENQPHQGHRKVFAMRNKKSENEQRAVKTPPLRALHPPPAGKKKGAMQEFKSFK